MIMALAKHGRFSATFKADWERLGGLDILFEQRWLRGKEQLELTNTLNTLATGPSTPGTPQSLREEHEDGEGEDRFDEDLPTSSHAL